MDGEYAPSAVGGASSSHRSVKECSYDDDVLFDDNEPTDAELLAQPQTLHELCGEILPRLLQVSEGECYLSLHTH